MGKPQTFRSPVAVVVWVVWLLFAVANWIDLAVQGRDHTSAVAAAVLLLGTGVAYVTALRPRVIADDAGVTIRNPLRDHQIGWATVTRVDLAELLRVYCAWADPDGTERRKVIGAWAVHISRRRQLAAEVRARRVARFVGSRSSAPGLPPGGRGQPYATPAGETSAPEADAEMIARLLGQRATAARAEAVWAAGTAETAEAKAASGPAALGSVDAV